MCLLITLILLCNNINQSIVDLRLAKELKESERNNV